MNTSDQQPVVVPALPRPERREYHAPQVIDLGDVREITRGGNGSVADGPRAPKQR
jgi:hypothetical protein